VVLTTLCFILNEDYHKNNDKKIKLKNGRRLTSGLAKWRLFPLTRNGEKSHHAGQICETPLRQAAGALSESVRTLSETKIENKKQ
jgi:hypothetical protein